MKIKACISSIFFLLSVLIVPVNIFAQFFPIHNGLKPFSDNFITANPVPKYNHIVVVIGENTNQSAVYNSVNAPCMNALAASGAKFTNSHALFHPSQPNYIALFSGSNQGIINDDYVTTKFTTNNLGSELINSGKTFVTYSEDLPAVGFDGHSSGLYVRKHNASANWMGSGNNQIPESTNQPFTSFPADYNNLPNVAFVIPNLCSDGHDVCAPVSNSVRQFDNWVQSNLGAYMQWAVNNKSLLVVTYDEDDFSLTNKIATIFYGAYVAKGAYSQKINHYSVLRTIEEANRLNSHAGAAANTAPINYCWTSYLLPDAEYFSPDNNFVYSGSNILIYPIPADNKITIVTKDISENESNISDNESITWEITEITGAFKSKGKTNSISPGKFEINLNELRSGIYLIRISDGVIVRQKKFVIVH